ncbi:hypothetical protein DsansV1_C05g0051891 [Dioscorea sansibarensis]
MLMRRIKLVVLVNSNSNIPSATETLWKDNKVSSSKLHKLSCGSFGVSFYFAF